MPYHTTAFPKPSWSLSNPVFSRQLRANQHKWKSLTRINYSHLLTGSLEWPLMSSGQVRIDPVVVSHSFFVGQCWFGAPFFLLLSKAEGGESHAFNFICHCQQKARVYLNWFLPDPSLRVIQTKAHCCFLQSSLHLCFRSNQLHIIHNYYEYLCFYFYFSLLYHNVC